MSNSIKCNVPRLSFTRPFNGINSCEIKRENSTLLIVKVRCVLIFCTSFSSFMYKLCCPLGPNAEKYARRKNLLIRIHSFIVNMKDIIPRMYAFPYKIEPKQHKSFSLKTFVFILFMKNKLLSVRNKFKIARSIKLFMQKLNNDIFHSEFLVMLKS